MGEAAAGSDLAQLLAEAAAGLGGADGRLAARLRPDLASLLNERLAAPGPVSMAEAGQLVLRHWHHLAGTPVADGAGNGSEKAGKARGGRKGAASGKARRGGKGKAARQAGADALAAAAGDPLFARYAEEAAEVMQLLVSAALQLAEPDGAAMAGLHALAALSRLDPALAKVARLRWFAGLDDGALARLLGQPESHVQRDWIKARAFLAAAARAAQPA